MLLYACTIFASAFLLFLVQPLMAKQILPWFGGSAAVWTTCLVFFQSLLLAGYAYAHASIRFLRPRTQALLHIGLLAASLIALPIIPGAGWKPVGGSEPGFRILLLLLVSVGLPYFLLSTTGPLLQAWYSRTALSALPYRLFALSNLASLIALVLYPFAVEPWFRTRSQAVGWSSAYAIFVLLAAACAWRSRQGTTRRFDGNLAEAAIKPTPGQRLEWLALSALSSILLLAVTNYLTQNVAAIPFLWILPLSLYLLTFILCFEGKGLYWRRPYLWLLAAALLGMGYAVIELATNKLVRYGIPVFAAGLFVCCMFCHGELSRRRPAPRFLTSFYLLISLGGALGACCVGLLAPRVFPNTYELSLSLTATALLAIWIVGREAKLAGVGWACVFVALIFISARNIRAFTNDALTQQRNFYGSLRVIENYNDDAGSRLRHLIHGTINHGTEFLDKRVHEPTSYYSRNSGIGLTIANCCTGPKRIGVIGLGAGTLAAYGQRGDVVRFYEINPLVPGIARQWFHYLPDTPAKTEIVLGDARLSLENEPPQKYDVLAIDAFSGDSIPTHLITKEAVALYLRHLKPGGVMAFHISNLFLDLSPVVQRLADEYHLLAVDVTVEGDEADQSSNSEWILLTWRPEFIENSAIKSAAGAIKRRPDLALWTDDFNNLFSVLRPREK